MSETTKIRVGQPEHWLWLSGGHLENTGNCDDNYKQNKKKPLRFINLSLYPHGFYVHFITDIIICRMAKSYGQGDISNRLSNGQKSFFFLCCSLPDSNYYFWL